MNRDKTNGKKDALEKIDKFFQDNKADIKKNLKKGKKHAKVEPSDKMSWPPDDLAARRNLKDE
jgi:hypothetical protein